MQLTSYLQDRRLTMYLSGEIDHHCAKSYMNDIAGKLEAYTPKQCVLDFQEVTFMDSSGIAVVINALRLMKKLDGQLILRGLSQQPLRVFKAAGIEKIVNIEEAIT